ncbi:MAG: hypothetical protein ABSF77_18625 [Spirochaetia bacterium]|jgi:hypothetical protein
MATQSDPLLEKVEWARTEIQTRIAEAEQLALESSRLLAEGNVEDSIAADERAHAVQRAADKLEKETLTAAIKAYRMQRENQIKANYTGELAREQAYQRPRMAETADAVRALVAAFQALRKTPWGEAAIADLLGGQKTADFVKHAEQYIDYYTLTEWPARVPASAPMRAAEALRDQALHELEYECTKLADLSWSEARDRKEAAQLSEALDALPAYTN